MNAQLNPRLLMTNNYNKNDNYEDKDLNANQESARPVRMAAIKPKYTPLLCSLLFLLLVDFTINSFSELTIFTKIVMIIIYM